MLEPLSDFRMKPGSGQVHPILRKPKLRFSTEASDATSYGGLALDAFKLKAAAIPDDWILPGLP